MRHSIKTIKIIVLVACFIVNHSAQSLPLTSDDSLYSLMSIVLGGAFQSEDFLPQLPRSSTNTDIPTELPFVVIVCSYNNGKWSENTLDSIFSQNYNNFRLIIVDDCSSDNNVHVIQNYIDKHKLTSRVTFIRNEKRMRKLSNLYKMLHMCKDDEIVLMVDGDDWLDEKNKNILHFLNSYYQDPKVWLTYGQYRNVPMEEAIKWGFKEIGYCREVPEKIKEEHAYRKYPFIYMHPRSFRAWLFKLVKLEDLIAERIPGYEGDYYPAANDVAMFYPMVEMAHRHVRFISDILYIRNLYPDIVGFKVDKSIQVASAREIRKKQTYPQLSRPQIRNLQKLLTAQADLFILCNDELTGIEHLIYNAQNNLHNVRTISIFYEGTEDNKNIYRKIKKLFNENVVFVPYNESGDLSLKNRLLDYLIQSNQGHIIVTGNAFQIIEPIDLSLLIYWLEKTQAHTFYLGRNTLEQSVPRFVTLDADICAWKFLVGQDKWHGFTTLNDMTLHKRMSLINELRDVSFGNPYDLDQEISHIQAPLSKIGLFFRNEKVRTIT